MHQGRRIEIRCSWKGGYTRAAAARCIRFHLPTVSQLSLCTSVVESVHIENEYIRLMILPEIGGRIHVG